MTSKRIYFDARYVRIDQHDGISRFSAGLFEALQRKVKVVAIISDVRQLEKLPPCEHVLLSSPTSALEPFVARQINKFGADVVFSPMQTMGASGRKYKLILTLHDLIYYRHPAPPAGFNWAIRTLWRLYHLTYWPQRFLLNRADAVVTVSKTTKRLIAQHRLTKRPVTVVYNAADAGSIIHAPTAPSTKKLIYMGSFMDYKNVETLIRGMKLLPDFELVLLSRISATRKQELERLAAGGKVSFAGGVSEQEYLTHIDSAFALVTASKDEGFGIPLVEAMSRGIPVVVSDIEIFREIGGEAALFFDQEDPHSFANKIESLNETDAWIKASKLSLEKSKQFNWDKSAQALLELIDSL